MPIAFATLVKVPGSVTRRRRCAAARCAHGALILSAVWLLAAGSGAALAPPENREAQLEEIRAEIAVLQARLGRLADRREGLAGVLARTELQVQLQEKRVEEVRAERRLAQAASLGTQRRVEELELGLERSRRALRRRLEDLYRLGRHGSLRLLFSVQSRRHIVTAVRMLRFLAHREAGQIEGFVESRVRLAFERDELAEQHRRVDELLSGEHRRLATLERLRRRQSGLLGEVESERTTVSARASRLIDKEQKLAHLVDFLVGRSPERVSGTPIQEFRGALDWPAQAPVVGVFGPRLDPRYGTRVPHNGIDLDTQVGSEIQVIFPGQVLFAAPFEGFGLTVVVSHSGRALSLYAGLEELRVTAGDVVSLDQAVGVAGSQLYFEIRVDNRPQDPLGWLR